MGGIYLIKGVLWLIGAVIGVGVIAVVATISIGWLLFGGLKA